MTIRVAINGLGRIGRATLKQVLSEPQLQLVAVNDIASSDNLAYLLKYDTVYGRYEKAVEAKDSQLIIDDTPYQVYGEKDPTNLPWRNLGVDVIFECTGIFRDRAMMEKHLEAGARIVILSAPAKGSDVPTIVYGTNAAEEGVQLVSCASCTTNCITPVVEVMDRRVGVEKAVMTTVHAYTSSQALVDSPASKYRRGRAGAANIVPTTTGAAKATGEALPQYRGRFDGMAIRVPVAVGSAADITFVTSRPTSAEEINGIFREEAESNRYRGVLGVAEAPVVSADIIGDPRASIVDMESTLVVDGDLVKILSWYDNEWGYSAQMIREAKRMAGQ